MKLERRLEKINKVRNQGLIPGVIYGKEIESTPVQVDNAALMLAFKTYGRNKTFKVSLDKKNHKAYFKEVQINLSNPNDIVHFSLLKVTASDTITADIPIVINGKFEIETQNLIVQQIMYNLQVDYPASESMDKIELDVSKLKLGEGIFVKDIALPKKFSTNIDGEELVVNITYPKVKEEEAEEGATEAEPTEEVTAE